MSLAKCKNCERIIDTDADPESGYVVQDEFICWWCRDDLGWEWGMPIAPSISAVKSATDVGEGT